MSSLQSAIPCQGQTPSVCNLASRNPFADMRFVVGHGNKFPPTLLYPQHPFDNSSKISNSNLSLPLLKNRKHISPVRLFQTTTSLIGRLFTTNIPRIPTFSRFT